MKAAAEKIYYPVQLISAKISIFFFIFRKEKVHQYFLILVLLLLVAAAAFFIVEHQTILKATQEAGEETLLNKILAVIYWSIITISTTGYGDIIPQTNAGRVLVIIILFLSIGAVSLFTANLASALTSRKLFESRGIMEVTRLRNHFVICGWKENMGKVLGEIVKNNPQFNLKKVVMVANVDPDNIDLFRQNYPEFKDVIIMRGDHYNEAILKKANVAEANKVVIISPDKSSDSGVGVDSLTVLTAMTIGSISMSVSITAELQDVKFEKYLRNTYVDEIIFTNEYNSALLANSLLQSGVTKVINDLLINHQTPYLTTDMIPEQLYNETFKELKNYYHKKENSLVIGLLEDVGNLLERKKEAIRSAQQTADVSLLIDNLKTAKNIENNRSNLLPDDDYIIPRNSLVILIKKAHLMRGE